MVNPGQPGASSRHPRPGLRVFVQVCGNRTEIGTAFQGRLSAVEGDRDELVIGYVRPMHRFTQHGYTRGMDAVSGREVCHQLGEFWVGARWYVGIGIDLVTLVRVECLFGEPVGHGMHRVRVFSHSVVQVCFDFADVDALVSLDDCMND